MKNRFKEAKEKLESFNARALHDTRLRAELVDGPYDYLQWYQQPLFVKYLAEADGKDRKKGRGREHAVFFRAFVSCIVSLFAWTAATLLRRRVVVFGIDKTSSSNGRDFRIERLYACLDERRVHYLDILHTIYDRGFFKRLFRRKRLVFHQEAIDLIHACIERARGAREEDEVMRWKHRSDFRIRAYRFLLAVSGIKTVLAIDDVRHMNELMAACQEKGIPFYAFQHGHFTKYHAGWQNVLGRPLRVQPTAFFVWSPYWKKEFARVCGAYDDARVKVGGNPKAAVRLYPPKKQNGGQMTVLVGYESEAPKDEMKAVLARLIESEDIHVIFSLRPDVDASVQTDAYGIDESIETTGRFTDELDRVDVVVGTYSTMLYDVIAYGKPVVIPETSLDYGQGMVENGLADHADAARLVETIQKAAGEAAETVPERQERLFRGESDLSGTVNALFGVGT